MSQCAIRLLAVFVVLFCWLQRGGAAERALILTDQEQKDLVQALDAATKAQGLSIAPATVRLYQKLITAPTVSEQKEPSHDTK